MVDLRHKTLITPSCSKIGESKHSFVYVSTPRDSPDFMWISVPSDWTYQNTLALYNRLSVSPVFPDDSPFIYQLPSPRSPLAASFLDQVLQFLCFDYAVVFSLFSIFFFIDSQNRATFQMMFMLLLLSIFVTLNDLLPQSANNKGTLMV